MLARLWWKEWRIFGPAGALMILAAAGVQWIYLLNNGTFARDGSTTNIALIWSVLYAYAAGAAAFAGERESKTMGFLDALPVSRRTLWTGKASFALASTLALVLALLVLGAMGTNQRNVQKYEVRVVSGAFAVWIIEGLGWGLFWSSLLRNPLSAAILAVGSAATVAVVSTNTIGNSPTSDTTFERIRVVMALLALGASAVAIRRDGLPIRLPAFRLRDRGPGSMTIRPASATRVLAWQTFREGWTTWLLGLFVVLIPTIFGVVNSGRGELNSGILLAAIGFVAAGVGVFGPENVAGTRAFLRDHGASPWATWARKVPIWVVGVASLLGLLLWLTVAKGMVDNRPGADYPPQVSLYLASAMLDGFAIGMVCGMAGRRRITAALVAVIGLIFLAPIQILAASLDMVPGWTLLISPALLVLASLAWAGDWLADRGGFRPYARLGLLVAVPLGLEAVGYAAYRAWSIPDPGPIPPPAAEPSIPPGQDAAEAYREALALVWSGSAVSAEPAEQDLARIIEEGWDPKIPGVVAWLDRQAPALDLARKAAALPRISGPIGEPRNPPGHDGMVLGDLENLHRESDLIELLSVDARRKEADGDLAGAWSDILALLRMARHLALSDPGLMFARRAGTVHHQAVGLAIDWAGSPKQTAELIRRAFDDIRALPPLPGLERTLAAESAQVERFLALSASDLSDEIHGRSNLDFSILQRVGMVLFGTPAWERERARRVCRRALLAEMKAVGLDLWARGSAWAYDPNAAGPEGRGTPLARLLLPAVEAFMIQVDREVAGRRTLELFLGLRAWQFAHGGDSPQDLQELVPTVFDRLPLDPYSGRPFAYDVSRGEKIFPPARSDRSKLRKGGMVPTRPGQRLIRSSGPVGLTDQGGTIELPIGPDEIGGLVVPLP